MTSPFRLSTTAEDEAAVTDDYRQLDGHSSGSLSERERLSSSGSSLDMTDAREKAASEFRRMMLWIMLAGVVMVVGALWYLSLYGELRLHMVIATILGVFFSVALGCGLFAAAFYSEKSGHDRNVTDATRDNPHAD